jgi:hypothetical protein
MEEFLREIPGFVVVKEELWVQLSCYIANQLGRAEAGLRFMQERSHSPTIQIERMEERIENMKRLEQALLDRKPLSLKLCTCWHTSNRGPNGEELKHPEGFDCRECRNTGRVQLR